MTVRSEGLDGRRPTGRRRGVGFPPPIDDIPGLADLAPGADPGSTAALDDFFGPVWTDDVPAQAQVGVADDDLLVDDDRLVDDDVHQEYGDHRYDQHDHGGDDGAYDDDIGAAYGYDGYDDVGADAYPQDDGDDRRLDGGGRPGPQQVWHDSPPDRPRAAHDRSPELRSHEVQGYEARGPELRSHELRGHEIGGYELRGQEVRGHEIGGYEARGQVVRGDGRWVDDEWSGGGWSEDEWSGDDWVDGDWVDCEWSDGEPVDGDWVDGEWSDDEPVEGELTGDEPVAADWAGHGWQDEATVELRWRDRLAVDRPGGVHPADDWTDEPVHGDVVHDGPYHGDPVHGEPLPGPRRGEPIAVESTADDGDDHPGEQRWVRLVAPVALIMAIVIVVTLLTGDDGQQISNPDSTTPAPLEIDTVTSITLPRADNGDEGAVGSTTTAAAAGLLEARELPFVDTDPNTFWVGPDGDEANDGQTPDAPWASLQGALDRVQPGQTIYLMTGDYTELHERQAHYVVERGGNADAWVTITAGPEQSPTILATVGNGISVRSDYVEVSGIELRGEGFSADNPYGWGVLVRDAHHVRITDNVVSGMPVGGIGSVGASNLVFSDNHVFENSFWGTEQGSGISIWNARDRGTEPDADGYHNVISGNVIYRNENKVPSRFRNNGSITDGNGIIVDQNDPTGYTGRTLVANNVIFDNGGRAILVLESSRVDVYHNTTYHNGRTGALEGGPVELAAGRANDVRFLNNLSWALPGAPALRYNTSNGIVTGGNLLVSTNQDAYAGDQDRVVTGDPGLVAPGLDPAAVDFHPVAGGLATQVGIGLDRPIGVDLDGSDRPTPGAVGAYEPAPAADPAGN
ncbi:MAG: right-handed parallel beta-helix repeat-containing protein [Actinomycetota bacterium]